MKILDVVKFYDSISLAYTERFVKPAAIQTLAIYRFILCAIMIYYALTSGAHNVAYYPDSYRIHLGVMDLLYKYLGFGELVRSTLAVTILTVITVFLLTLAAIGIGLRGTLPTAAILYLVLIGIERSYTWFNHAGLIPWYCVIILSLFPSIWRPGSKDFSQGGPENLYRNGWIRHLLHAAVALPYLLAALSKLRNGGIDWWSGTNLQYHLLLKAMTPDSIDRSFVLALFEKSPDWAFSVVGISTLISEAGMILILWSRSARIVMPVLCVGMHLGILLTMQIAFWDLILIQTLIVVDTLFLERRVTVVPGNLSQDQPVGDRGIALSGYVNHMALMTIMVAGFGINWIRRGEYYPLTSMQMFSHSNTSGVIHYFKTVSIYDDGSMIDEPLDQLGVGNNRYLPALRGAFQSAQGKEACRQVLMKCGEYADSRDGVSKRIVSFRVEKHLWDFRISRDSVQSSKIVDQVVFSR